MWTGESGQRVVASEDTAQQVWREDHVEWEETFKGVSLKFCALWASANVTVMVTPVQTFSHIYLWGGVLFMLFSFPPCVICFVCLCYRQEGYLQGLRNESQACPTLAWRTRPRGLLLLGPLRSL